MIKVDGYCFLKYLPAILKAPKKNQTSIGPIAIGICVRQHTYSVKTSNF